MAFSKATLLLLVALLTISSVDAAKKKRKKVDAIDSKVRIAGMPYRCVEEGFLLWWRGERDTCQSAD
jgi:hypothetical protein